MITYIAGHEALWVEAEDVLYAEELSLVLDRLAAFEAMMNT